MTDIDSENEAIVARSFTGFDVFSPPASTKKPASCSPDICGEIYRKMMTAPNTCKFVSGRKNKKRERESGRERERERECVCVCV